ncbi:MAG: hypothetical protein ABW166_20265 [Sedimenticola sp.]
MKKIVSLLFGASFLVTNIASAVQPKWEQWDVANSVAKEGSWLVVRQPDEGFCYIKQGYDGYGDKLEVIVKKDEIPILISPFFRGIEGSVTYWVDDGEARTIPASMVLKLPHSLVQKMKRGSSLYIEFRPVGYGLKKQRLSLSGFTKAFSWLGSSECRKKVAEKF